MSTRAQGLALHPAGGLSTAAVEARRRALELEEEGTVALVVDPLLAIAGGIMGGALTMAGAWVLTWRVLEQRAAHKIAQALR